MKKILLLCILFCGLFSQDNLPNYSVKLLNSHSTTLNNLTDEVARNHSSYVKKEVPLPGRNYGVRFNLTF